MATIIKEVNKPLHEGQLEMKLVNSSTGVNISRGVAALGLANALVYEADNSEAAKKILAEE